MGEKGRTALSLEGIERALARSKEGQGREYLDVLRKRVAAYEKKYSMPSEMLRQALTARKLHENLDVVKWLHAYDTLVSIERRPRAKTRLDQSGGLSQRATARGRG